MYTASERQYTAAVRETQVLRGGNLFTVTEDGVRILMHGLIKLTQFCVSLVVLWSQNGSFQTLRSYHFLIDLCSNPYLWS